MSGAIPPLPQYAFMAWCSDCEQFSLGSRMGQISKLPLSGGPRETISELTKVDKLKPLLCTD